MTAAEKYNYWKESVPADSLIGKELSAIDGNDAEISSRFKNDLEFGTAGLRGVMGAGTDRMNIYTVRRAALAYGTYIRSADLPDTCAIAYDTRNNSPLFAQTCAVALAENGIHVYIYPEPMPTPALSFAVRHLKTGGGVVITASHNPAEYNGMKCYGDDGCQQTDDPAAEVFRLMQSVPMVSEPAESFEACVAAGKIEYIQSETYDAYYKAIMDQAICVDSIRASGIKVLYTPLHGAGLKPVTSLFDSIGVDYDLVAFQATPDGNFPTCPYPNPETEPAFNEAKKICDANPGKYDVIIATDPDADRVAIAVPTAEGIIRFSGNELGCMLLSMILSKMDSAEGKYFIKSIVTTPLAGKIAAEYGCGMINVLTGFKYIGSTILEYEKQGREDAIIFAYEESCGFLKGTYVRDKDAQIASVLACALTAEAKLAGKNLIDIMNDIYARFGYYKNQVVSINLDGEAGKQKCADFIDSLRKEPPTAIAGDPVIQIADYKTGVSVDKVAGTTEKMNYPSSNVLSFLTAQNSQIILRPSGTEPKLKVYYFAVDGTESSAIERLQNVTADIRQQLVDFGINA